MTFLSLTFVSTLSCNTVEAQNGDTIKVGYFDDQPICFRTGDGNNRGLAIDILEHISKEEGIALEITHGNRSEIINALENGEIDMIASLEFPYETDRNIICGDEIIISNWGVLFSSPGINIDSVMDLQDKWIGIVKDDPYYHGTSGLKNLIESFDIKAYLVEFDNYNEVVDAIETGNVDAGCLNNLFGSVVENKRDIRRTGIIYDPTDLGFAFHTNGSNTEHLIRITDRNMDEMKGDEDSIYYGSLETYLNDDGEGRVKEILPDWILRVILIMLGIVIFLILTTIILRIRIRMRTKELRMANERLHHDIQRRKEIENRLEDERNRSIFYLDLMIHDIGNIHHGLLSTMQLYEMVKDDRSEADRTQERARNLLKRSINFVKNVKKFAEAKTRPIEPEPQNITAMVKRAISNVRLSYPNTEIKCDLRTPENLIFVLAEPLLEEVFYNLIHNAVNYQDRRIPEIEIELSESGEEVTIEISDHGRGIPDDMKGSILNRPQEADKIKHTGMGLTLVKALLDRYDGKISVEDRINRDFHQGTRFKVILTTQPHNEQHLSDP